MTLPACCLDLDILAVDLFIPERMSADGWAFFRAHGLDALTLDERKALLVGATDMGAGVFKLRHRCAQLQDDGRCGVYATRPAICREFSCATRSDCACGGAGTIPLLDSGNSTKMVPLGDYYAPATSYSASASPEDV